MEPERTVNHLKSTWRQVFSQATLACPARWQLRKHALAQLPDEEMERVSLHLAFCGYCLHRYRRCRTFHVPALRRQWARNVTEAAEIWEAMRRWLHSGRTQRPLAPISATRGVLSFPLVLPAILCDAQGHATGERLSLKLIQALELDSQRLQLVASVEPPRYQNAKAKLFLVRDTVRLYMGIADVAAGRLEAQLDLSDLGVEPTALLDLVEVVLQEKSSG